MKTAMHGIMRDHVNREPHSDVEPAFDVTPIDQAPLPGSTPENGDKPDWLPPLERESWNRIYASKRAIADQFLSNRPKPGERLLMTSTTGSAGGGITPTKETS